MNFLLENINETKKGSRSFKSDLISLSNYFNVEVGQLLKNPRNFKRILKETFQQTIPNGLIDSIKLFFLNFRNIF